MGNFTSPTPTWVFPIAEDYNVITTQSETMKKEYLLLSATPVIQYRLVWTGISDGNFATILAHWRGVSGTFSSFTWKCVPSYIDAGDGLGSGVTGRWINKPRWQPNSYSWDVEMEFEKEIA